MRVVLLTLVPSILADIVIPRKRIDAKNAVLYRGFNEIDGVFVPTVDQTPRKFSDAVCENTVVNTTVKLVPTTSTADPKSLWYAPLLPSFKWDDLDWTNNGNSPYISTVFLLDTGVNFDHPEFSKKLAFSYKGNVIGDEYVHHKNLVSDENEADLNGHGTSLASLIVGGTVGVAKLSNVPVRLLSLKVLNKDMRGQIAWIIEAIDEVKKYKAQKYGGRYVNFFVNLAISLPYQTSELMHEAFVRLYNDRIFVVAGAGNDGRSACYTGQAGMYFAITVSGLEPVPGKTPWSEKSLRLPSFANYGSCVDVLAPATLVQVAAGKEGYAFMNGTSAATAFATASFVVSGTKANYGNLKKKTDILSILQDSVCNTATCASSFEAKEDTLPRYVQALQNNKFTRSKKRNLNVLAFIQLIILRWLAEHSQVLIDYSKTLNATTTIDFSFAKATILGLKLNELKEALSGRLYDCERFSLTWNVNASGRDTLPSVNFQVSDNFSVLYNTYTKQHSTDKYIVSLQDFYALTHTLSATGISVYLGPNGAISSPIYTGDDLFNFNFGMLDSASDNFGTYYDGPVDDSTPPPPPVSTPWW